MLSELMGAPQATMMGTLVKDRCHRGTLKIKADPVNLSEDTIKFHTTASVVSKKYLCCGFDNPYMLIERARVNPDYHVDIEDQEIMA